MLFRLATMSSRLFRDLWRMYELASRKVFHEVQFYLTSIIVEVHLWLKSFTNLTDIVLPNL